MISKIHQAPPNSGSVFLGRTLPSLLQEANRHRSNPQAFHQATETGWKSFSSQDFQTTAEGVALGLLNLGLKSGDRVAFLIQSDVNFCIVDFGCLIAHLIDVPIDLTQTIENIVFVLQHSEAKVLFVANAAVWEQLEPYLQDVPQLQFAIFIDQARPQPDPTQRIQTLTIDEICVPVQELELQGLYDAIAPSDIATIVYIPSETGDLQGVMLTHENLSANALASFSGLDLEWGDGETVLSFLPLTHVFARSLIYGHIYYGHCVYFSHPNRVMKHLQEIRPTILASVPLLLEKIYSRSLERINKSNSVYERSLLNWALMLAKQYPLGRKPNDLFKLWLKMADWLLLGQWRSMFGGRMKYLLSGGASLRAELATVFSAAGIPVLQGYGLTQTSSVICHNREPFNRAGTVGVPMAGTEIALAEDDEILMRGPYLMAGYYKNPEANDRDIDADGWFHTGDLGTFSDDGFLTITGTKKALFKLSTGKYIAPAMIEERLKQSPFIQGAIAVGADRKFCAALLVPNRDALHQHALTFGVDFSTQNLLEHPCIVQLYQAIVETANCHLPYWAMVKRFRVLDLDLEPELLNDLDQPKRRAIAQRFAEEIEALYAEGHKKLTRPSSEDMAELTTIDCPIVPIEPCPVVAQSLHKANA